MAKDEIIIRGAKENNLKDVSLTLPRNKFIVFTGLSGSGKSSLAFDTIYAEGQRRYVESLSSYARQFLGQMDKPDVEYIEGLSPSISIDQKTTSKNPRSTVGTVTEIYDYLRLLYARIGTPYCHKCGKEISSQTVEQMVDKIMEFEERTKIQILAPIIRGKKGEHVKILENIKKEGFVRVIIDDEMYDIGEEIKLEKNKKHTIEVVVDRIVIKEGIEGRLADSLETALKLADGLVVVDFIGKEKIMFSEKLSCPDCNIAIEELSPRMFSFNSPFGMCPTCNGLGFYKEVDKDLVIPNLNLSIDEGGIAPFSSSNESTYYYQIFKTLAEDNDFSTDKPLKDAPQKFIEELLYGTDRVISFKFLSHFDEEGMRDFKGKFEGIIPNLERRYAATNSDYMRNKIDEYMAENPCPTCKGRRLKDEVLAVRINKLNIAQLTDLSITKAIEFFDNLVLTEKQQIIGQQVFKEIKERLNFLKDVGLDYLTLSRTAGTLSGGESQRIRLATQIGSSLVGVVYVLDEPSIGLHQRDNEKLLKTLRNLTDLGNTLIVVEHDEDTMYAADHIVDIGPGAGIHGGYIVGEGTVDEIKSNPESITGLYLSGKKKIEVPKERRQPNGKWLEIIGAEENNLKNIDVKIPLGLFTCVTGVSGSGKSSLVNQILHKTLAQKLNGAKTKAGKYKEIKGIEYLDKVIDIDQSPIGRTPRSNPATYTGVFDHIRDVFAMTNEAKMRGYQKGRFSFNVKGGRCEACSGDGILKVEMHFLPDVYVPCEVCKGKRYNRETLQVKYKGKTISDVLDMTVEEGVEFFKNIPKISRKLETLFDVGLGYIKIGQSSTELSGGEAQRVKLATELSKRSTGKTIYILDEPTTGLHVADIHKLIKVLNQLVEGGNTVVVIEHNLDVIKTADYIIDLGPEGGDKGGTIVTTGTPEEVAKVKKSYTGQFLKKVLD
ncbi:excinuclease ABC subunit A [Tissierella praeacuta DSM 18095]|uniref:UvrABC system protein A n=1 Tax=Tissierella praeacuta DSM 18095 TaxID=1123404 RepID=A0A1M4V681_9FIRM|nr:excinuclease ABC subunit UvrA [Tissierella praeacuta]SHE64484.1 excinuclease ABC subunit A [Tissierella praeacuta DSM 18095]SUP02942.1 Excinuclease ABC subunit A [Tissierella praeacuta]